MTRYDAIQATGEIGCRAWNCGHNADDDQLQRVRISAPEPEDIGCNCLSEVKPMDLWNGRILHMLNREVRGRVLGA